MLLAVLTAATVLPLGCGGAQPTPTSISATELAARIEAGNAPLILDVRSADEYRAGHIPGSVNIPHDQLADRLAELGISESDEVVVHCQRGGRAEVARDVLGEAGFTQVRDLDGHMQGWRSDGLPTQ